MSNIAKRIADLSPERRELLARLLKQERVDVSRTVILPRSREVEHFPLSYAQQRLWFLQQLEPDSPFYNIPDAIYFDGALDIRALERSFTEIVRRHEVLRTTFQTNDGQPLQVISPPRPVQLEVTDLTHLPEHEREREAQRLANEEAQRPFDLTLDSLLRLRLLRLDAEEHVLLVTMHHIISDGWSVGVLAKELTTLYAAYREEKESPLEELPVQYADYAVWQREWLQGEVLEEQLAYWREQLGGELPVLELPADRPRPAVQTFRGASEVRKIGERVTKSLRQLSREGGATLFMTLLAAFDILLSRYTNQPDILVGTPIANRTRAETEDLIGFFVNTLVLRTEVDVEKSFRELLAEVREATLGGYAHQDVPFEKLVEELQPERRTSHTPFFQVVFTVRNEETGQLNLSGTSVEFMPTETGTAKFDLRLAVTEAEDTLLLSMRYSTDLFDAPRIRRMLEHFEQLLESIVADPSARISKLSVLSERERGQVLAPWKESRESFAPRGCLHEMFAAQVRKTPEAVALACEDERLTYRELDERANRLANYLRSLGVGAEVLVGLCVGRSARMLVGLVAVLKAGGAYLPLEPEYPQERLAFMLADAPVRVLLTERAHAEKFAGQAVKVVCLDGDDREAIARESADAPESGATPDNLAYVIYTSGSTGRPKGTQITHANVARLFAATERWFDFDGRDVWTLFHSYAFDFSVWEMWGALLYGGRLVVVPYLVSRSPEAFHQLLSRERVTILNQTPSAFRQLMRVDESHGDPRALSALRLVVFGGEALEMASLKPWFERHGDTRPRLVNMYGITETTVHVTYRPLNADDAARAAGASTIGMPIPDLDLYVLDRDMNPVPFGIPGEMYVGGAGVARAYLDRPELTAERFPPDPFSDEPGARLYRTGDLARLLPGGDTEYLGRLDQQVKIRGFRIELGEIETALAGHASIVASIVIAREDQPGDRRLTAYLVGEKNSPAPNIDELRGFLRAKLPEHMIPAAFVWIDSLPLTINGKIDRRRLPAPGQSRPALERVYVAPRDTLETLLAEMWRELLGIEQIGVEDDFFGLGGDSIKGAIFINRLQERLGEIVHVITIFQSPTIAELAAYLREQYAAALRRLDAAASSVQTATRDTHDGVGAATTTTRAKPHAPSGDAARVSDAAQVDAAKIEQLRRLVKPLPPRVHSDDDGRTHVVEAKNPPAIFVLSPPRSGSTLFRVMLAGHPALFAPPELELLSFNTLAERRANFSGAQSFWLEGTIRAIMEIRGCEAEEAKAVMQDLARRGLTTKRCYALLQEWIGERRLVDKTPSYALDASILRRAETDFDGALYIHLLRHPYGMIRSFEEARLEQIFFRYDHPFTRRELAELIWLVSHRNIVEFLRTVPKERQHLVRFEELLEQPEATLRGVCDFLGLDFAADMLQPYRDKERRMTDGIHAQSRMLGDVKFHRHTGIDARVGSRWREQGRADSLAGETWALAARLGYEREAVEEQKGETVINDAAPPSGLRPIPRLDLDAAQIPLSFAQQRLWFIHQLSPHSPAYNIPLALRLSGRLDLSALELSFTEVVKRHAALRTTFPVSDGEPVQVISPPRPVQLEVTDLTHLPQHQREQEAQRLANKEAQRPFDLTLDSLLRLRLLRLDAEEHVLLVTMHHIISDGWSVGMLAKELTTLYAAYREGKESPLEELPVQYADYAVWQREWLRGEVLEEQLAYWREQLGGELPVLELPTDRPRPAIQTFRGAGEAFELGEDVSRRLRDVSRECGATLFMTLLAAFKTLLCRYTNQTDIVVGTPIAGRSRAELEQVIGFFVNTLALRTRFEADASFLDLLRRVKGVTQRAYGHQDVPFEKLVDELQPPRDPSRTPLFQVSFTLQDESRDELSFEGLELSWLETESSVAKFDLSLAMSRGDGGLDGVFVYNADLFDAATIERMARHFETLLESVAANRDARLSDLPLLTEEERRQLLVEWNDTQRDYPRDSCIHQLFEEQAARAPDATAVFFEGEQLSYGELNARANQLARHLRSRGVAPDVLVGVYFERSVEMIVAVLAVLKAGGAYVPLDPSYPAARLRFMAQDAGLRLVLAGGRGRDAWPFDASPTEASQSETSLSEESPSEESASPSQSSLEVVYLDALRETLRQESAENPDNEATAENLAYVIYTSGSTGEPKGVGVPHRGVVRLVRETNYAALDSREVFLQFAPLAFDASTFEIWGSLLNGARLAVMPPELPTLEELGRSLERYGVTTLWLTAGLFHLMVDERLEDLLGVRQVLAGGDVLSPAHVGRFLDAAGGRCTLVNGYGPTENTTFSCCYTARGSWRSGKNVPIGRPVSNTQTYVLDARMQPVVPGATGELYLGGDGLARGYHGRPELTAERFVPHPFSREAGARLYRTGDVVRYLGDGNIEFVGRRDEQVKLRGFRIELGEIEARLKEHETVRDACVLARADEAGEKRLVAYVVADADADVRDATKDADEWRAFLKERLPEYMLPTAFVLLDALPLTPNGKVDRRALPTPAEGEAERAGDFVAPRDALESQLAGIWEELLNVRPVGVRENFFSLGGHSLLVVRMAAQVSRRLGRELPLASVLQAQTVEELASLLRQETKPQASSPLVAIQPRGSKPPFFCVHPAGGSVACYTPLARGLGDEQPFYGLRTTLLDADSESVTRLEEMAAHYVEALRAVQPEGAYMLGGWSLGGVVAYEMAQQLQKQGQRVALLALIDSYAPEGEATAREIDDDALLRQFAWNMGRLCGTEESWMEEDDFFAQPCGVDERLRSLLEQGVRAGVVPSELALEQLGQLFQVFRTNVRAMLDYRPRRYDGRITLFRASERFTASARDPSKGWRELAAGGVEVHLVPGDHYTMMTEPQVRSMAARLKACLDGAADFS